MENELSVLYQREYKDKLFKFIFGRESNDSKEWRLQLYNALNGTHYENPDALKINTIENVIYISMHNDISFLIDSEMDLYEQQSSQNPNMPLRGLFYFSLLYHDYIIENKMNRTVSIPLQDAILKLFFMASRRASLYPGHADSFAMERSRLTAMMEAAMLLPP